MKWLFSKEQKLLPVRGFLIVSRYFSIVLLIFCLAGCSSVASFILGIKDSEFESKARQVRYLRNHDIDTSNMLVLKTIYSGDSLDKYDIMETRAREQCVMTPIQFRMFDRAGNFISGWAICCGPANYLHLYDTFPPKKVPIVDGNPNLFQDIKMYETFDGKDADINRILANHQYIIIAYWAKYLGIPSRTMLKKLEKYIAKNKDKDIVLVKVNLGDIERKDSPTHLK